VGLLGTPFRNGADVREELLASVDLPAVLSLADGNGHLRIRGKEPLDRVDRAGRDIGERSRSCAPRLLPSSTPERLHFGSEQVSAERVASILSTGGHLDVRQGHSVLGPRSSVLATARRTSPSPGRHPHHAADTAHRLHGQAADRVASGRHYRARGVSLMPVRTIAPRGHRSPNLTSVRMREVLHDRRP